MTNLCIGLTNLLALVSPVPRIGQWRKPAQKFAGDENWLESK